MNTWIHLQKKLYLYLSLPFWTVFLEVPSLLAVETLVFIHWESGLMILLGTFAIWLGGEP
jgi:hypothetical protein